MLVFYTKATSLVVSELLSRISALLGSIDLLTETRTPEASSIAQQTELYKTEQTEHFKFQWIGIRFSGAARLVGAVVTQKKMGLHTFLLWMLQKRMTIVKL